MYASSTKITSLLSVVLFIALVSGCDTTGSSQEDEEPSTDDVEAQVQEVLGSQVSDFQIREIDVGQVTDELESGETTLPIVTPHNEVREINWQSRPADLRPDSVDTGILREGDATEEVPLPPEQSYLVGDPETSYRIGGLTVLDDDRTMLRGLVQHSDFGISYFQSVNHLLRTDDHPNLHVLYNAENTEDFDIGDGDYVSADKSGSSKTGAKLALDVNESTGVVLDGDVDFYDADPSTVWRRQESLLFGVELTNEFVEPLSSEKWRLELSIAGQEVWVSGGPSTSDPDQLMNELEDPGYFLINSLSEKEMHLFLVGYDVNGLAGRAGGIGTPNGGWGGGSGDNHLFSETIFSQHINRLILAHEVGHLIGGHHGNSITSGCSGAKCGRSLMNPTITHGTEYFFSDDNDTEITEVIDATLP